MIELILIFPIIACVFLFFNKSQNQGKIAVLVYAVLHLLASLFFCFQGSCFDILPTIFDFYFKVDNLNILFLLILSVVFVGVAIYNYGFVDYKKLQRDDFKFYSITLLLFVLSMSGAILSTNLGLSWVFIEATTLTSAYLIYFNKTKHSIEATWKYVFICSIGIALAFVGIIFLSISTGGLNSLYFSDLYSNALQLNSFWLELSFIFILVGIGTKMGLAPMHFWLPDAHSEAPSPISALLSATLLNSAFLIILRVYKLMLLANIYQYAQILLISMGLLSIFVAAVFIFKSKNYKRMLAYSSIENMGIITIGTALGGVGMYAALLHMVGHSLIKASFFLSAGNILKTFKTKKIKEVSGILKVDKKTGWLWVLSFMGIMALPPSPLFISEFILIKKMIVESQFIVLFLFLFLLTIIFYGMGKRVVGMSFGSCKKECVEKISALSLYTPQFILLAISLVLGIYVPQFLNELIKNAMGGF